MVYTFANWMKQLKSFHKHLFLWKLLLLASTPTSSIFTKTFS